MILFNLFQIRTLSKEERKRLRLRQATPKTTLLRLGKQIQGENPVLETMRINSRRTHRERRWWHVLKMEPRE